MPSSFWFLVALLIMLFQRLGDATVTFRDLHTIRASYHLSFVLGACYLDYSTYCVLIFIGCSAIGASLHLQNQRLMRQQLN
jgi:hypothetical protein